MTPENAAGRRAKQAELTPENKELLAKYAGHLERSPLTGHSPRTCFGAIRRPGCIGCTFCRPGERRAAGTAVAKGVPVTWQALVSGMLSL